MDFPRTGHVLPWLSSCIDSKRHIMDDRRSRFPSLGLFRRSTFPSVHIDQKEIKRSKLKSFIIKDEQPLPRLSSKHTASFVGEDQRLWPDRPFLDLETAYRSCRATALNLTSSPTTSTQAQSWIPTIDGRLEAIQRVREQGCAKLGR